MEVKAHGIKTNILRFLRHCNSLGIKPCERDIDEYFGNISKDEREFYILYCFYYGDVQDVDWNTLAKDVKKDKIEKIIKKMGYDK